ncbi:MAG: hypothetical protein LBP67_08225 [Bacteroidales bacterium]|jgi:hypothetical protein|nr:hypothetical protein [Bacteroidales bacterium]
MISSVVYGQNYVATNVTIICPEITTATVNVKYALNPIGKELLQIKEIEVKYGDLNYGAHVGSDYFWVDANSVIVTVIVMTDSGRYAQQSFTSAVQNVTFDFR